VRGRLGFWGHLCSRRTKAKGKEGFFLAQERRRPSAQEHGRLVVSPPYHYGNPEPKVKPRTHSTATKITTPIGEVGTHATLTPPIASSVFRNTVTQAQAEPPAWWSCLVHLSHLNTMTTFREITMSHYLLLTTTLLVRLCDALSNHKSYPSSEVRRRYVSCQVPSGVNVSL